MSLSPVIRTAARNWSLLEVLYEAGSDPEKKDQCYVSALATKFRKANSEVSVRLKDLEQAALVEHEESKADRRKYYRLSTKGTRITKCIIKAAKEKTGKIKDTDPEQLDFLLERLNTPTKTETLIAVNEDFREMCETTSIWKLKDRVWPIIEKHIKREENPWAMYLFSIIQNMVEIGEEKEKQEVKKEFLEGMEKVYMESISPKPSLFQETVVKIIGMLASDDEKIALYKKAVERAVRRKDKEYVSEVLTLKPLDEFMDFDLDKDKKKDLREWFYELMDSEDQSVRKKALWVYREDARKRL